MFFMFITQSLNSGIIYLFGDAFFSHFCPSHSNSLHSNRFLININSNVLIHMKKTGITKLDGTRGTIINSIEKFINILLTSSIPWNFDRSHLIRNWHWSDSEWSIKWTLLVHSHHLNNQKGKKASMVLTFVMVSSFSSYQ